ncbi:MAG: YraN family protein [Jatrophihabitans sp.]|uniref:YraN family protein n=1 Tax=Jatrophihabitans sp. TaxID=1932789 RepID=UPI003F81D589
MRVKDAVGRFGEDLAARHLQQAGLTLLDRNWRCHTRDLRGELDIVALDGATVVFVEVKTRSTLAFGRPSEAVTPVKLARLRRLAAHWLAEQTDEVRWREVRFDVVSVLRRSPTGPVVEHLAGVA